MARYGREDLHAARVLPSAAARQFHVRRKRLLDGLHRWAFDLDGNVVPATSIVAAASHASATYAPANANWPSQTSLAVVTPDEGPEARAAKR